MTAKGLLKGAAPVVAGFAIVGLTLRYFGDKPFIIEIKKGLNGDVNGWFK